MYSKAFIATTLLGAAAALPAGTLPSLNKESSPYKAESSPASSPYEKPAPFEKPAPAPQAPQASGPPTGGPQGGPPGPPPWAERGEKRVADVCFIP